MNNDRRCWKATLSAACVYPPLLSSLSLLLTLLLPSHLLTAPSIKLVLSFYPRHLITSQVCKILKLGGSKRLKCNGVRTWSCDKTQKRSEAGPRTGGSEARWRWPVQQADLLILLKMHLYLQRNLPRCCFSIRREPGHQASRREAIPSGILHQAPVRTLKSLHHIKAASPEGVLMVQMELGFNINLTEMFMRRGIKIKIKIKM